MFLFTGAPTRGTFSLPRHCVLLWQICQSQRNQHRLVASRRRPGYLNIMWSCFNKTTFLQRRTTFVTAETVLPPTFYGLPVITTRAHRAIHFFWQPTGKLGRAVCVPSKETSIAYSGNNTLYTNVVSYENHSSPSNVPKSSKTRSFHP